jgi:hypothetical protein
LLIASPDGSVTFARAFLQPLGIQDPDLAARVSDEAGRLQGARHHGHARSPNAQHLPEIFLRELKLVAAG